MLTGSSFHSSVTPISLTLQTQRKAPLHPVQSARDPLSVRYLLCERSFVELRACRSSPFHCKSLVLLKPTLWMWVLLNLTFCLSSIFSSSSFPAIPAWRSLSSCLSVLHSFILRGVLFLVSSLRDGIYLIYPCPCIFMSELCVITDSISSAAFSLSFLDIWSLAANSGPANLSGVLQYCDSHI